MNLSDALKTMNQEDQFVPKAIEPVIPNLTKVIESAIQRFNNGGRIIYIGAGTSGRLGVLDAAECVPTFNVSPNDIIGIIAGAEDDAEQGAQDLKNIHLQSKDIVVGISASGRTPYVKGALDYANKMNAETVALSCNVHSDISKNSNHVLEINVGPEVLTGSTRLKSGTAQKLVLNMISTMTMIGVGKVYDNLMVDLRPTNQKLIHRSIRIIQDVCDLNHQEAIELYEKSDHNIKIAIVMHLCSTTQQDARLRLKQNNGVIKQAINT